MAHINPKSKNGQSRRKQPTGNTRRGNRDASTQARRNLARTVRTVKNKVSNTVKNVVSGSNNGGGGKAPASNYNGKDLRAHLDKVKITSKGNVIPLIQRPSVNVTPRGNELVKLFNNTGYRLQYDQLKAKQAEEERKKEQEEKENKRRQQQRPVNVAGPYEAMIESGKVWEHLNDPVYNASPERQAQLKVLQNYSSSPVVVDYATRNLQHSNKWFVDADMFGDAVLGNIDEDDKKTPYHNMLNEYLGTNVKIDPDDQEAYNMYLNRFRVVQDYFKRYTHSDVYYDASLEGTPDVDPFDGYPSSFRGTTVMDADAPLPPWVENTPENQEKWSIYLHRSDEELKTINEEGMRNHHALQEQAAEEEMIVEKNIQGKVGSAASELGQEGVINSLSDAVAASFSISPEEADSHYFRDYFRDYWINPLRTGHYVRFLGNRLMDAMDLIDLPAKGVRAALAAQPHILYDGNQMFEGQEAFVYSGGKERQKLIMENGGLDLFNALRRSSQGYTANGVSAAEARAKLESAGLLDDYNLMMQEWEEYEPQSSVLGNLKEAYTTPGKDFATDTGNFAADMALDIMLDPTMIIGGGAKAAAKGITKNVARDAVDLGIKNVLGRAGTYESLEKEGRLAVEGFIRNMDPKTMLFKKQEDIDSRIDAFVDRLVQIEVNANTNKSFHFANRQDAMKEAIKSTIHERNAKVNAGIVASSEYGLSKAETNFLKTVYRIGYTADKIDSTLLKLAFPEPFVIRDSYRIAAKAVGSEAVVKASKWMQDNIAVGKFISTTHHQRKYKKLNDMRRLFGEEYKDATSINLDQIEHFKNLQSGKVDLAPDTQMRAIGAAHAKVRAMSATCDNMIYRLRKGTISSDNAMQQLRNELQYFAGRETCNSLEDLDAIIKNKFDGFFGPDYANFKYKYREVEDFIAIRKSNAQRDFIDALRNVDTPYKLFELLKKYRDHLDYTDPDFLHTLDLKYNKAKLSPEQLKEALEAVQTLPKVFSTNAPEDLSKAIEKAIKDSAKTDPRDFADLLEGTSRKTAKEIKDMLSMPEYGVLKALVDNKEIKGFQKIRSILSNGETYIYKTEELQQLFDQTFFDVHFAYKGNIPTEVKDGLVELKDLRMKLNRNLKAPVSVNNGAIYRYQLDRMVIFDQLINDERVLKVFDKFNNDIRPLLEGVDNGTFASVDAVNHKGFYDLLRGINRTIQSTNLFHTLNSELDSIINAYQKYAILDNIFGLTSSKNDHLLSQIKYDNSKFMRGLDTAIYSSYGESKIGIRNARVRMKDYKNSIWGKYSEELNNDPELQRWVKDIVDASPADPMSYVNLQILQTLLIKDDAIQYYNDVNKYNPVVFMHCSTSGLNPTNSNITGIAYKQWTELPENASLRDIFEKIINPNTDTNSLRIAAPTSSFVNIEEDFLKRVYDSHLAAYYGSHDDRLEAYAKMFGVGEDGIFRTEEDVVREFCEKLQSLSYVKEGNKMIQGGVPCLVYHDFEGFNMPFFKNKVFKYNKASGVNEIARNMDDFERLSENSFDQLKYIVNDQTLTLSEKEAVRDVFFKTFEDMKDFGEDFNFLNLRNLSKQLQMVSEYVGRGNLNGTNDSVLKQIEGFFSTQEESDNWLDTISDMHLACSEMKDISDEASNWVLYRNSTTAKVGTGLYNLNDAEIHSENLARCYNAIDRISELCGITTTTRTKTGSHIRSMKYETPDGAEIEVPGNISIPTVPMAAEKDLPGYYDDPALVFLHEFGHFIQSRSATFTSYIQNRIKLRVTASGDLDEIYRIEREAIHDNTYSDERLLNEIFVQGLALHLRKSNFVDRLKKYYPEDLAYQELIDTYSEIAKTNLPYAHNPSEQAKLIEYYQTNFMKITGLDKTSDFAEELAATMRSMVHDANADWKVYMQDVMITRINPIRNSRKEDPLQFVLNMQSKHDMTDLTSFFEIPHDLQWEFYRTLSIKTYDKMTAMAKHIIDNKNLVRASAEKYLTRYKKDFDYFITVMQDFAVTNGNGPLNSMEYLVYLKTPNSAVESYLMAQKVYDDFVKMYKLGDDLKLNKNTFNNGRFEEYLQMRFVDGYGNPLTNPKVTAALNTNGILGIFNGNHDHDIWQHAVDTVESGGGMSLSEGVEQLADAAQKAQMLRVGLGNLRHKFSNIIHLEDRLANLGIKFKKDYKEAMLYQHVVDIFNNLVRDFEESPGFQEALKYINNWRKEYAAYYNLQKLITNGVFDKDKLINELLWNGFGCHVIIPNKYTANLETSFVEFVKNLDVPFIDYSYEGGAFVVYLKKGFTVQENTKGKYRYVTGHEYLRSTRNQYDSIPFPEYEDIVNHGLADTAHYYTPELHEAFKNVYKDIDYFSDGATQGTLGNRVSMSQVEDFFNKMPRTYADMEPPYAMLQQDMMRSLVCDPGFISSGESNIFMDITHTMQQLERTTGDVKLAASFIFGEHSDTQIKDMLEGVSNKEALEYFSRTEDYVIVQIKEGDTHSGMFLQQIKPKTEADVEILRTTDASVVPFELFVELQSRMNYKDTNSLLAVFNKALVLFKATSLANPGSWIRNYIDALTKAVLAEDEGGVTGATQMISRGFKANKEVTAVMLMQFRHETISEGTWDSLVTRYHLEGMTWDDYQLLSGLLDRDKAINTPVRAAGIREGITSGKDVDFSSLSDADVEKLWKKNKLEEDKSFGMDVKTFNAIRTGKLVPTEAAKKEYDEVYRKVLIALANRKEPLFDRAVNKIFTPFNMSEVTARYAQMLWLRDLGYTYNQSIKRVADTQFRTVPNAHLLNRMEYVVPFATFKYNNAMFWMRMIEERPEYFRLFEHIYGQIAQDNYEDMIQQDKEYSIENDYMLKTGGIPIGGTGMYFKLDPSCLDFFRIFYGGAPQGIRGLNPLIQYAFKYSMYELGYSSNEFLKDFNYKYDLKSFIDDTVNLIPGVNQIYDLAMRHIDKSYLYENTPTAVSQFFVKWFPQLFAGELDFNSRSYSDFSKYQEALAKDGKWYDLNDGKIKDLSEKNELGANDPRLNWDDVQYFMMVHFGKVWDSNLGKFVPVAEKTEGGLNQEFDLDNDPDAWDKLCAEYKKKGMVFDYNVKHFVLEKDVTPGGLNESNLSFKKRTKLYKDLFGLEWDANQNKYVDAEHYIAGGLNDIDGIHNYRDWNRLKAYRRVLYGEVYERFDHPDENGKKGHFVKRYDPKVVTLESLMMKSIDEDNYYQYVALPRMASADILNCKIKDGFIRTADGKYVLTWNRDYNNRVLEQFVTDSGFGYGYRRRNFQWRNFGRYYGKKFPNFMSYRGFYTNDNDFDYFYQYNYNYNHEHDYNYNYSRQYKRSDRIARVRSFDISRGVPYGGIYNKFSFYTR